MPLRYPFSIINKMKPATSVEQHTKRASLEHSELIAIIEANIESVRKS
jgi:hypothetical protein